MQAVSVQTGCRNPPSKLEHIEEKSQPLREKFVLLKFLDGAEDNKDVDGLLGDVQEAIGDYMVRPRL